MIKRPSLTSRRKKNQSVRAASANVAWYRRATMLGIMAMAGVASYYVFPPVIAGWTTIQHVSISGVKLMKRGEILSLLALSPEESLWAIHPRTLEARLEAHPRIASASVGRALPHTLAVVIGEREPVAAFQHAGGQLFVDQEGVVLSIASGDATPGLPVFSGLSAISLLEGDPSTRERARLGVTIATFLRERFLGPLHIELGDPNEIVAETENVKFHVNQNIQQTWPQYLALESTIHARSFMEPYDIDLRYSDKVIVRQRG